MMGSIGVTVALIGWALFFAIEQLASAKYHAVRCVRSLQSRNLRLTGGRRPEHLATAQSQALYLR